MSNVIQRYQQILQDHQTDRQTAATLVLAEAVHTLVRLLNNVDQVVQKIDATNENAVKYIQGTYVAPTI